MKRKTKNILCGLIITSAVTSVTPIKPFAQEIYDNSNVKEQAKIAIENRSKDVFTIYNKSIEKKESKSSELVGNDRFDTAIKVSQAGWNSSKNVVLVNANSLADALSVTPFASQEDAPVLLSNANSLNSNTKKEISRLGAKKVYIIGGISAISENIVNELKSMGITVERISGEDRYQTSLAVAKKLNNVSEIAVVNGEKGFADAVSIAPVCARDKMAIVYASPQNGLNVFNDFIKSNNIKTSYVVGGTAVLPDQIVSTLKNSIRIAGSDRNSTNLDIIKKFYSNTNNKIELDNLFIAKNGYKSNSDLIDALSVGVLAGKQNSPIMLVSPTGLDTNQSKALSSMTIKQLTQIGGNGNENAFNDLKDKIESSSTPSEPSTPSGPNASDNTTAPSTPSEPSTPGNTTTPSTPSEPSTPGNLAAKEEANKVIAMIDTLNSKVTLDDYEAITDAREAYDKLSNEAKTLVTNLTKLTKAEAEMDRLEKIEIDKYNEVIDIINSFEKVTASNIDQEKAKLNKALDLISKIHPSEAQNIDMRVIEEKKAEIKAVEDIIANPITHDKVRTMIDGLNKTIDVNDENDVEKARVAYESLSNEDKALVGNIDLLTNAETKMKTIMDKIDDVFDKIHALAKEITLDDKEEVKVAREAFNDLSKDEQKKIPFTDMGILQSAEAKIAQLEQEKADKIVVNDLMDRIKKLHDKKTSGGKINIEEDEAEIKAIRAEYEKLEIIRQLDVKNYSDFVAVELDLSNIYGNIIYVEGLIIDLPDKTNKDYCAKVEEAKKKFDALTDKNQVKVKQELKDKLKDAIAQANKLKS